VFEVVLAVMALQGRKICSQRLQKRQAGVYLFVPAGLKMEIQAKMIPR
jgi:hypothetical protein